MVVKHLQSLVGTTNLPELRSEEMLFQVGMSLKEKMIKLFFQLLLYDITGDQRYLNAVNNFLNFLFNEAQYTPKGLIFIQQWGSLRHAGNVAHFAAQVLL